MPKRLRKISRLDVLKGLSILAGFLLTLVCSAELTFNVYANALKAQLNYTQSEVALSSSLLSVGAYLAIPAGILYDRVGIRWNFTIGAAFSVCGYSLFFMAIVLRRVFTNYSGLVAAFHYLCGQGMQFMSFTSLVVNVNNVPVRHRGKVASALAVAFSGGAVILALVYSKIIAQDGAIPLDEQELEWFALGIPISLIVVYIMSLLLIRPYESDTAESENEIKAGESENGAVPALKENADGKELADGGEIGEDFDDERKALHKFDVDKNVLSVTMVMGSTGSMMDEKLVDNSLRACSLNSLANSQIITCTFEKEDETAHGTSKNLKEQLATLLKNLKLINVHLAFWAYALPFSVDLLFIYSSTAFVHSARLDEHILFFTTTALVIALFLNFIICVFADFLYSRFSIRHTAIIFALNVAMLLTQIPLIFSAENYYVLAVCDTLAICFGETLYAMTPTLLSIRLGGAEFGLVWGTFMTFSGFVNVALLKGFGAIYDSYIDTSITRECFGQECLTMTFVMTSIVSFLGSVVSLVLFLRGW